MKYDPQWQEKYAEMLVSPRKALSHVRPGQRLFIGTGCAEPPALIQALVARAGELADVEIVHLLTKGDAPYAKERYSDVFALNSFYIGGNVRDMIQQGVGSYTPIIMSDIPRLFNSGQLPLDVALIQVTPPNEMGRVSLGVSVDVVRAAAENASLVIAQVNPQMPWTLGDSTLDICDLDILVAGDGPITERQSRPQHEVAGRIAHHVASLVEDGSTLQFGMGRIPGIGHIPEALMHALVEKKDLGIHTEMITDAVMELIDSGALTCCRKAMDKGKIVTSFCMGTRKLYDLVDDNPLFSFRPTEYVNDSAIIARQHKMVAINMALEIDLTGQVCADSRGDKFYSGIGGQVDFNRGAAMAPEGKSIIVISSLSLRDKASRIVCRLTPGSGVVTTRGAVQYVASEYGVAYLAGKNIQERALALIAIAHPDYREQLFREAIAARYIREDFEAVEGRFVVAGEEMKSSLLMDDGTQLMFRPIHPTDEPNMRDLIYDLSQETIYYRFMSNQQKFGHQQIHNFVWVDHRKDVAIVGVLPEAHGEDIVAVGRYYLDEGSNRAEVAFVIRDSWQNRGVGTFLFKQLISIAKRNGISGFSAQVLRENKRMQAIFNNSGYAVKTAVEEGVYSYMIEF
ncbi:MAG: GNAT family N-acetyltransferase [Thermodesulfobacteriota bacterium]